MKTAINITCPTRKTITVVDHFTVFLTWWFDVGKSYTVVHCPLYYDKDANMSLVDKGPKTFYKMYRAVNENGIIGLIPIVCCTDLN